MKKAKVLVTYMTQVLMCSEPRGGSGKVGAESQVYLVLGRRFDRLGERVSILELPVFFVVRLPWGRHEKPLPFSFPRISFHVRELYTIPAARGSV